MRILSQWRRLSGLSRTHRARLVVFAVAAVLGVPILINLLLNLGISRPFLTSLISSNPKSVNIDYQRAWSFWPTRLNVRNIKIRGSDANLQWQVEIDEAQGEIDLIALFKREFHLTKLRAQGIGVRVRQKIELGAASSDRLAPLPTIEGFEGPPLLVAGPRPPDIPDSEYDLWSVRIENVEGYARQIWIDEFRFEGEVYVTGSFFLRPKRWLWVGPASAQISSGHVVIGNKKLLDGTVGSVACTITPFDPRWPFGREAFRFISGSGRLDADIPDARALDYYPRIRGSAAVFEGGEGAIHVDGTLRSGTVRPLNVSIAIREVSVKREPWLAIGSLQLSGSTEAVGRGIWQARVAPFQLRHVGLKSAAVLGTELQINATAPEVDLSQHLPDFQVQADLFSARLPDLRLINTWISPQSPLRVDQGEAAIAAHFNARSRENQASGVVLVGVERMSAHHGNLHFEGKATGKARIHRVLLDSGDLDLSEAFIDIRNVTVRESNLVINDWWSRIDTQGAKLRPTQTVVLDIPWTGKLQSAVPVLAFSRRTPSLPSSLIRLLAGGEVEASGRLQVGNDFIELSDLKAHTGLLRIEGDVRLRGNAKSGALKVSAGLLSAGVELRNQKTEVLLFGTAQNSADNSTEP